MNQIIRRSATIVFLCSSSLLTLAQCEAIADTMGRPSNAPFTASWTQTSLSTQADGMTVRNVSEVKVSRDSFGRIYIESRPPAPRSSLKPGPANYWVEDPVKHIDFSWSDASKRVVLGHEVDRNSQEYKAWLLKRPSWVKDLWAEPLCFAWDPAGQFEGGSYKKEQLGTRTILGIPAQGIRATRWLPAGYKGYNQPATVTEERWYSADLQLALQGTIDDPRVGRSARELTNLEQAEPDPSLFRLPSGYAVYESPPDKLP